MQNRRLMADMLFAFKVLHGMINYPAEELGLRQLNSTTRGVRLVQRRAVSRVTSASFSVRVPSEWNKLPSAVTNCRTIGAFKRNLSRYLLKDC
jgi:hypothetical protein